MKGRCLYRFVSMVSLLCLLSQVAVAEFIFDATVPLPKEVEETIERGQAWIASRQRKNGSWGNHGDNAMACVALMVNGTTPGKGKYGTHVAKGIDYIISTQEQSGFMAVGGEGPMYQHALATLALAEAYGMTHNPKIRAALIKAVDLLVETQHYTGGWRYTPKPSVGDLSVTVMQIMALRASSELGIFVPDETIEHAVKFVRNCWQEQKAGFGYMAKKREKINFNRTGAGVVCLQSVGRFDDPAIPKAIETIRKRAFNQKRKPDHFWYGHYYASVALYHHGGEAWKEYYPMICSKIMKNWKRKSNYGKVLDTSWAILVMGVPYRYLPIYQR